MKFAICNEIFQGFNLDDTLAAAARFGFDGLELAPFTLAPAVTDISAAERGRVRQAAARHGIQIAGIHWVLLKPEGLYINHPEVAIRQRTARYLCDLVDFCADLGGTRMVVGSPKQRNVLPGVSPSQAREWALETFRPAGRRSRGAPRHDLPRTPQPGRNQFHQHRRPGDRVCRPTTLPSFQIILDVKAMCSESKPIPQIIRESWPHFAHFHANDRNFKGPGFGDVDFVPIAAALKEVGYDGFVSVEVFKFDEGPQAIATQSLEYLKRVFA